MKIERCNVCGASLDRTRDLRWRKDGFDIVRCRSCGTLARADLPDPDALRDIYGPAYFSDSAGTTGGQGYSDYLGEEQKHRANAASRLKLLERYGTVDRLLDVGCAAGFFLDEARRLGWEVEGVELAAEMAEYARSRLDLEVHGAPFAEVELEPQSFDAVTMWDYLEHSIDPAGDLERAATLLRRGGVLAVSTGDAASIAARLSGRRWHLLTPRHHNYFFTRASLEQAFRRAGFEVVAAKNLSSLYSLQYLVHKLRTLTDRRLLSRLTRALEGSRAGGIALRVNLYDIVTVIGRRT